jgi:tetratricopeptide (TPR) repeat protein
VPGHPRPAEPTDPASLDAPIATPTRRPSLRVFLSHSTKDREHVALVQREIETLEIDVYLAEHDPKPGTPISAKVEAELSRCHVVVVLITSTSVGSAYVWQEVGFARRHGTPIVPIVWRGVDRSRLGMLSEVECLELDPEAPSEALAKMAASLQTLGAEMRTAIQAAVRVEIGPVAHLSPEEVGVDPVDPEVLGKATHVEGQQLNYAQRDIDRKLREHVANARHGRGPALVCVHGPSKAGKSRTMFEALRAEMPQAALVAPADARESVQTILDQGVLVEAADRHDGLVVLWLDDLEGFVRIGRRGVDANGIARVKREVPGLVVIATAGGRGAEARSATGDSEIFEPLETLMHSGVTEHLLPLPTSPAERDALHAIVPTALAAKMEERGLGAVAVSGERLVDILVSERHPRWSGGKPCPEGAALTRSAIDAYRLGVSEPIPADVLRRLFRCHTATPTTARFDRALEWATTPLYGNIAPMHGDDTALSPYDYLVQHAPQSPRRAHPCVWSELMDGVGPDGLFQLGLKAHGDGTTDRALEAYRRADERGVGAAAYNLGLLLTEHGDLEGAEAAYRRGDERGVGVAAFNLGALLEERGDLEGAEAAWRRADERGVDVAAANLGVLLKGRGDLDGAEAAWRRGDERGDGSAAFKLGALLNERRDLESAEAAYRRGDERGDAAAANGLGVLLEGHGDVKGAEAAYRRSDERGNDTAAFNLGALFEERGDLEGAEAAYRRGDERGSGPAANNLGALLRDRGDIEGAKASFSRGDERGIAAAANNLGTLLRERGDLKGAEAAFCRGDERGDGTAAFNLGLMLRERGDLEDAEAAWHRADELGDGNAVTGLGGLLDERGDLEGAEAAYRRGDERGIGGAAHNLGLLLQGRGDLIGAETAWRRADERGVAAAAYNLGVLIQGRGDLEGAEAAYRRGDERGYGVAANNLGVLLARRGDLEGAKAAFERAILKTDDPEVARAAQAAADEAARLIDAS